ncbi:MAG TPA: choice-of-anchor tandem repeat GloVer-containing protein [Candidatus Cybelea sp.]|jgi:uncharacterized repeat protein (TIGR03803 family)|nr:choice-of-anchor tandem repeat GloVer-containing protein [Candidatus Cybelea sp.]
MKRRIAPLVALVLGLPALTALDACGAAMPAGSAATQAAAPFAVDRAAPVYKSLHLFKGGGDGANPYDALTPLNGSLYGVTYGDKLGSSGLGTVFRISASGEESVLYRFKGSPSDGAEPVGKLVAMNGMLYGTSYNGGAKNLGTVFAISPAGKEHLVYSFQGGSDGTNPAAGLTVADGKFYGTTVDSGGASQGDGTVFEVTPAGAEHVLHTFQGFPTDGESPYGQLLLVGNELYGTTQNGGANHDGTVFAMSTAGKERFVYSFAGPPDGGLAIGGLIKVGASFYGTTEDGGSANGGAIFKVSNAGKEQVVYSFKGQPLDGSTPRDSLVEVKGSLYGTTYDGGKNSMGSIFETTTAGKEQMLYSFKGEPKDGANPFGGLVVLNGVLYGTALSGGFHTGGANHPYGGSVFKLTP